ncbi:LPS translocon maturation chaperone LptM [Massilia sp. LXY-6]|uniref:LPS translocon maturation chaperone LptM n=1 Tax=Massilia sp. LXY-6 TaxID=3379823 RepID=UPI003EE3049F
MKSPFALPAFAAATLALLSACGQPGPLYMPKPPARAASTPAAPVVPVVPVVPATTASPPAPAAGMTTPAAGSNANNTQAPQSSTPPAQQ